MGKHMKCVSVGFKATTYRTINVEIEEDETMEDAIELARDIMYMDETISDAWRECAELDSIDEDYDPENRLLDLKESIAGIIFEDNELSEDYERPNEQHCHELAELILNRLNL